MGGADHLAVGLLRVVDTTGDALRARLAADRLLSAARPSARGLGPHEILVVRTLRDPLPGACGHAPAIGTVVRWRDAVEARLEEARALAARPAAGPVPTGAPAVLFGDLAELLACLTIDGAAGVAAERWWWRSWLRASPAREAIERAWIEHAEQVPATLELLSARRALGRLPRALSLPGAATIAAAVARSYDVPWLPSAAPVVQDAPPPARDPRLAHATVPGSATAANRPTTSATARRLLAIVPELAGAELPPEHRRLLGLGLALRRQRQLTRRDGFRHALDELAVTPAPAAPATPPRRPAPDPSRRDAHPPAATSSSSAEDEPAAPARRNDPPRPPRASAGARRAATARPDRDLAPPSPAARAARRVASPPVSLGEAEDIGTSTGARTVVTNLGGLFMLPSVALHLGLYGDFSQPLDRPLKLDPWDLVELLGRALAPRAPCADPAWALLAELAGRAADPPGPASRAPAGGRRPGRGFAPPAAADPPGRGFRPPRSWRLPLAWLEPFGPGRGPWRWHATDGRLRARHPAGFLALDVALRGDRAAQLDRELRRLHSPPAQLDPDLRPPPPRAPLERWTRTWLAPYVGARLRLALGARRPSAAVALTLRHRARVTLSAGRVDVTYALDDLPVAIRLAGLDRTPGWIPAAGRHLELHFV